MKAFTGAAAGGITRLDLVGSTSVHAVFTRYLQEI